MTTTFPHQKALSLSVSFWLNCQRGYRVNVVIDDMTRVHQPKKDSSRPLKVRESSELKGELQADTADGRLIRSLPISPPRSSYHHLHPFSISMMHPVV